MIDDDQDTTGVRELCGQAGMPGEGPHMIVWLAIAGDRVVSARYDTYGCPSSLKCGEFVTSWAVGRQLETLGVLEPDDLVKILSLPLGKEHVAALTVKAIRRAIEEQGNQQ